jgi:hypothetical protein
VHEHAADGPADCFGCKCAYWREHGVAMQFAYGRETFHGPTIRERAEQQVNEGRAAGYDPVPVGGRWV